MFHFDRPDIVNQFGLDLIVQTYLVFGYISCLRLFEMHHPVPLRKDAGNLSTPSRYARSRAAS